MKGLKVLTCNVNGIRSAEKKGFFSWLKQHHSDCDVICLQEVRAPFEVFDDEKYQIKGYHSQVVCAQKKGYSGVAIYSKVKPLNITTTIGHPLFDDEGRFVCFDFGEFQVVSLYLHSGSSGDERQLLKVQAMDYLEGYLLNIEKPTLLAGDINIVHTERDIKNFKTNQKTSGCLPEERAWLDKLFNKMKWVDAFRQIEQADHSYTWWSNRGKAYDNNVGWRIDYQWLSPQFKAEVLETHIHKGPPRFSDHAPFWVRYQLSF